MAPSPEKTTLADLKVGVSAKIAGYTVATDESAATRRALELGVSPGTRVTLTHRAPLKGGPIAVQTPYALVALGQSEAESVIVEEIENG